MMSYHYTPTRMVIIKKLTITSVSDEVEKLIFLYIAGECKTAQLL